MAQGRSETTYEISLKTTQARVEVLKGLLQNQGIAENQIVELAKDGCFYLSLYFKDAAQARKIRKRLTVLKLRHVSIQSKFLKKKDWESKWKADFKSFKMTSRFRVVPDWLKKKYPEKSRNIYIGTGLAFGTGMHATTRFMARMIERLSNPSQRFLDIGTGTGILTLVALKCGAREVTAIDISREAIKTAKANFLGNGFTTFRLKAVGLQKFNDHKKYDFVAANLITYDLIAMGRKIVSLVKPGKYLAVSGISLNNYEHFREHFDRLPLCCLKIEKGDGWVALLYKRIK